MIRLYAQKDSNTSNNGGQLSFRRRLFTSLGIIGGVLGVVSAIRAIIIKDQLLYVVINLTASLAACVLVLLARRAKRLDALSGVVVGSVFMLGFGAMFIGGAGAYGTMPTYFILALVFVSLMFDGKRAWLLNTCLIVFYIALIVIVFFRPVNAPVVLDTVWLWDMVAGFIGSAVGVSLAVMWQVRLYQRNEESLAMRNQTLEKLDQARAEFLGNVSHELKTPLAVIDAYAQTTQKAIKDKTLLRPESLARDLAIIATQSTQMALLVSSLVDVARIDEGVFTIQPRPTELSELVQNTLDTHYPIITRSGNTVEVATDADWPMVFADPQRISQVLVNLLVNASKHTHSGLIRLDVRVVDQFAEITVSDTGSGIAQDELPSVFERYKTATNRTPAAKVDAQHGADTGVGLGLFIAHHIITRHGGAIWIKSTSPQGTTVVFTIPVASTDTSVRGVLA
jgi:signal transduction histidine kinase